MIENYKPENYRGYISEGLEDLTGLSLLHIIIRYALLRWTDLTFQHLLFFLIQFLTCSCLKLTPLFILDQISFLFRIPLMVMNSRALLVHMLQITTQDLLVG